MKRLMLLVALLSLTGCSAISSLTSKSKVEPVMLVSKLIGQPFTVQSVQYSANMQRFTVVDVHGLSQKRAYSQMEYRVIWQDLTGFTVGDKRPAWKTMMVLGQHPFKFTETATNARAKTVKIYVRDSKKEYLIYE